MLMRMRYRIYVEHKKNNNLYKHPKRIAKMIDFNLDNVLFNSIKSFPHLSDGRRWFVIEELVPTPLEDRKQRGFKVSKMFSLLENHQIGIMFQNGKIELY